MRLMTHVDLAQRMWDVGCDNLIQIATPCQGFGWRHFFAAWLCGLSKSYEVTGTFNAHVVAPFLVPTVELKPIEVFDEAACF